MGSYVNGVYVPIRGEVGWDDEINDLLTVLGTSYLDVTLAPYGADPTGVADATGAIQAAIDDAEVGGGNVFLPSGDYKITASLTINSPGVTIYGVNRAESVLQALTDGFNVIVIGTNARDTVIRDIMIRGAATSSSTYGQYGISAPSLAPSGVVIDRVRFSGTDSSTGLNSGLDISGGADWTVAHCYFERLIGSVSNTGYGILAHDSHLRGHFHNNHFIGNPPNGRHAIYISSGSSYCNIHDNFVSQYAQESILVYALSTQASCDYNIIHHNQSHSSGSGTADTAGIALLGKVAGNKIDTNIIVGFNGQGIIVSDAGQGGNCIRNTVENNYVSSSYYRGIAVFGAKQTTVKGNVVWESSVTSAGTYPGIEIYSGSTGGAQVADQTRIIGNVSYGSTYQRCAFRIDSTAPTPTATFLSPDNVFGLGNFGTTTQLNGVTVYGWYGHESEGFIQAFEVSDPDAPVSNSAKFYVKDNGAGKTQLVVRFPTGAVQVIATEP